MVTSAPGLGNDAGELIHLSLGTSVGSELQRGKTVHVSSLELVDWGGFNEETYPLLGQLAGTLVLGIAEQLNDAALVGGETVVRNAPSAADS